MEKEYLKDMEDDLRASKRITVFVWKSLGLPLHRLKAVDKKKLFLGRSLKKIIDPL
jgi:hypothetical protein